ncbi:unnamed protein product [Lactuca saligna]|uniref:Uncharacterized protein n=1 Tax=Lactuca saligna TaxID=75948 RepID=A0AA35YMC3_LACSI|nr:unnamed protein product [Lactuca saligna]
MSPNAKGKFVIEELPENDNQGAEVEGQIHVESPSKNMNYGNDEPIGEYMSLILFGSKNDTFSPEYTRGRVGNSKRGEGSCSKRLNLEEIMRMFTYQMKRMMINMVQLMFRRQQLLFILMRWMVLGRLQMVLKRHQMLLKDATIPHVNNDDQQLNELFDNLMKNLIGSDEDDAEYEGDGEPKKDDESQEVDDIMDVDNNIEDVDVDMGDFTLNVESDVEGSCINGVDRHEPEDMEVINNEEFKSLDEGSDKDRERRALINNLGKEKRCNLGGVHKQSFLVGDKFKSKKELKEVIDLHALESRRNIFLEKWQYKA